MPTERTFEPWPWLLAGLLVAMISGSLSFYAIAARHPDPVVVNDAYTAGLQYNEVQADRRRATQLGYELALATQPVEGGISVTLDLRDRDGARVRPSEVTVRRERPSQGGYDAAFALRPGEAGFGATIPLPLSGRWHLVATAVVDGETLERTFAVEAGR